MALNGARPAAAAAAAAKADVEAAARPAATVRRRHCAPQLPPLYDARPSVLQKTRKPQWRQLQSRWRWFHAFFFWAGPPARLLWRVFPVLALNMTLACIVAADHLLRAAATKGDGMRNSFLPNITDAVIDSLAPMVRFMLFAASMLLTLRLGRVYERWWSSRLAFSSVGSAALALSQRVTAWCDDDPACDPRRRRLAADVRRWSVVWHYSILQVCLNADAIDPAGAALLTPEELAIYSKARKGRQICVDKLVRLIADLDFEQKRSDALEAALQRGVAAAGVCTAVRFQALPYTLTLISSGFVELFLLSLVLMMVQTTSQSAQPETWQHTTFTVAVVLGLYFGINLLFCGADEVANQLESPFEWLPCRDVCATTQRDVERVAGEMALLRTADEARARREGSEAADAGDGGARGSRGAGAHDAGKVM